MREHTTCEEAINAALARGHDGRAEFLATRCDLAHGPQTTTRPDASDDTLEETDA